MLWLITPTELGYEHVSYDCYWGFVVRAKNEKEARQLIIDRGKYGDEGKDLWLEPGLSKCEKLKASGDSEIILTDFHAG